MVKKFRNPEKVEEAMIEMMAKFAMRPDLIHEGVDHHKAEGLVWTSVQNTILNAIKAEGRRQRPVGVPQPGVPGSTSTICYV
jgi:hypothetical protein